MSVHELYFLKDCLFCYVAVEKTALFIQTNVFVPYLATSNRRDRLFQDDHALLYTALYWIA